MIEILKDVNIDWLSKRRVFLAISIVMMLAGLFSAIARQAIPGGTDAFNLGVDFREGTRVTVEFAQRPSVEDIRAALSARGLGDASVQPVIDFDRQNQVIIRVAQEVSNAAPSPQVEGQANDEANNQAGSEEQVNAGRARVQEALSTLGENAKPNIISTEYVGPVAAPALRNQAIAVTLLALVGVLLYIAFRFEWTYGGAAVITVFHDVLVTLGFFSLFQFEVNLTVVVALITLVGFSVNDTIVTFDRVRENLRLHRRKSLYQITNDAINETLSRTIITGGLVFLSVLALVVFGGEVLRPFSFALFIGVIIGTYSTIGIASPIMVWWQQRLDKTSERALSAAKQSTAATPRVRSSGGAKRSTTTVAR